VIVQWELSAMRLVTTSEDAKYIRAQGRVKVACKRKKGKVDKKSKASQKELKLPAPAYQKFA
jgi:hypothetical protein